MDISFFVSAFIVSSFVVVFVYKRFFMPTTEETIFVHGMVRQPGSRELVVNNGYQKIVKVDTRRIIREYHLVIVLMSHLVLTAVLYVTFVSFFN